MTVWDREPVMVLTMILTAVSVLLIAFVNMSDGELAAIIGLLTLVVGAFARSRVTPVNGSQK